MDFSLELITAWARHLSLPWLVAWGDVGFWLGGLLVPLAFGGLTLKPTPHWDLPRLMRHWDGQDLVDAGIAAASVALLGYAWPYLVGEPSNQLFEVLKLAVGLVTLLVFGYPALLAMPVGFLLGDLITGRPLSLILAWLPGYLLLPAYMWLAPLLMGRWPDFRRRRTWLRYAAFVLIFMALEPPIWSRFLAPLMSSELAYRHLLPVTWLVHLAVLVLAPLALAVLSAVMAVFSGLRWGEVERKMQPSTGSGPGQGTGWRRSVSLRKASGVAMILLFLLLACLISIGIQHTRADEVRERSQNVRIRVVDEVMRGLDRATAGAPENAMRRVWNHLLPTLPEDLLTRAYIFDAGGTLLADSAGADDEVLDAVRSRLRGAPLTQPRDFDFQLTHTQLLVYMSDWTATAAPYQRAASGDSADRLTVVVVTEIAHTTTSGSRAFIAAQTLEAVAVLCFVLLLTMFVSVPLRRIAAAGADLSRRGRAPPLPRSAVQEFNEVSGTFNHVFSELAERTERLELATRAANIGVWQIDLREGTSFRDEATCRLLDLVGPGAPAGATPWQDANFEQGHLQLDVALNQCRYGAAAFDIEPRLRAADGQMRELRLLGQVSGERHDLSSPWRLTGVCRDITQFKTEKVELNRRQAELEEMVAARTADLTLVIEQLGKSARAKSDFLSHISHEIRTPINAISGLTDLALRTQLNSEQRGYLGRTHQASEVLLALVNDVLDFSKIEAGALELSNIEFSLAALLDKVLSVVGVRAQQKGLSLRVQPPESVPDKLIGDEHRLSQVLLNLCNNAVKFTEMGEVLLSVHGRPAEPGRYHLRFSVRDTGIGITPAQRRRLFQPFNQADASIAGRFGGTGLGLAICHQLVTLMGGGIDVNSRPGIGSEFFFNVILRLGAQQPRPFNEAAVPETPPFDNAGDLRGRTVLVVDDDELNRIVVSVFLTRVAGMEVTVAEGGQAALQMLNQRRFEIVLMDMQMPEMNGIEATQAIRADARHAELPIIAFSADAQPEDRRRALSAGMNDYVTKPFRPPELLAVLKRWLLK
ncbi:MAG TPA: response regulator [Burkholderiaceae bacterium]